MREIKFYKTEKKSNPINVVIWISLLVLLTFVLSYFYSFISSHMPIIYFCVLITIGFGITQGFVVRFSSKLLVIVNKKTIYITSISISILAIYLSWLAYILQLNTNSFDYYFYEPRVWIDFPFVFNAIISINDYGTWGIMGGNVTGIILALVWIFEALILIVIPLGIIKGYIPCPYSMRENKWYKRYELNKQFRTVVLKEEASEKIATNVMDFVQQIEVGEISRHAIISIYFLKEEGTQYIQILNLRYDREGKIINRELVINNQEISKTEAENLIKIYHGKKSFFFE